MKLKILVYALILFLLLLLQSTLLGYVEIHNVKPNLLMVFIVCTAILRGNTEGAAVGLSAGLLLDMSFGKLIGFYGLIGFFLGLAVGSVNRRLYRENYLIVVFFTFVSTVVYEVAVYGLSTFVPGKTEFLSPLMGKILPEAIYNSIVAIPAFALVIKISRRFERKEKAARKY